MFAPITQKPKSQSTKHDVKQDWEKFTARPSSSLTGARCCRGSRTPRPRFSSDHEGYQSRQPTVRKSRKLSLGPGTFSACCGQKPETDAIAAGRRPDRRRCMKRWKYLEESKSQKGSPRIPLKSEPGNWDVELNLGKRMAPQVGLEAT
jgi:hypothetical protein